MDLDTLAQQCAQQTGRFFRKLEYDPAYCFELFRRALGDNDQTAWKLVYEQYRTLVAGWVRSHPEFERSGEEAQDFVNRAFERMWAACTPSRFECFRDLKSLLAYLKMCVHSAIMDEVRRAGPPTRELPGPVDPDAGIADAPADSELLATESREQLWDLVNARLRDEKERVVVRGLFVLDLKPGAIYARWPGLFRDTREIYRIRQIVLERLSRDPNLRHLVGENT
jgi:RNA polymerase sigma factor (sigma-70 family)